MKTIVTLFLFATLLFAQNEVLFENPRPYSAIGDVIYNNVDSINKLKDINVFSHKSDKIDKYVSDVIKTKKDGFLLSDSSTGKEKVSYLKKLRELIKVNDQYIREVSINFKGSIKSEDSDLFSKLLNSGLLDIQSNKKEILKYYSAHSEEVDKSGVIEDIINRDILLEKKKAESNLTYKQVKAQKIKRIKEKDRAKKQAIIKALEEEAIRKKINIRNRQKKELSNP